MSANTENLSISMKLFILLTFALLLIQVSVEDAVAGVDVVEVVPVVVVDPEVEDVVGQGTESVFLPFYALVYLPLLCR